jgi:putative DNA primase/helicase
VVELTGPKAGLWKDHATDECGDLIDLYRMWRGYHGNVDFVLSLKEIAKEFLGDAIEVERSTRPTATQRIAEQKEKLGTKPCDDSQFGAAVATYDYYDPDEKIIAQVCRYEPLGTRESKTFRPWCSRRSMASRNG